MSAHAATSDMFTSAATNPPKVSAGRQWLALTEQALTSMRVNFEFLVAVLAPLVFTAGFYLPLKLVMQFRGLNYAQYLLPVIVLQAMAFTAISAAQRSAGAAVTGWSSRLQTMPVSPIAPLASRMSALMVRSSVSLVAAIVFGYVIGFRFHYGVLQAVLFCILALAISLALSLGGDAIGSLSASPEATSQALTLPQLILGMLSTGFVPQTGFPEWIRPFVRNQPISQFAAAMRDMADIGVTASTLLPALAWCLGLFAVFTPLAVWASVRRR